jgi:hypothetical protein
MDLYAYDERAGAAPGGFGFHCVFFFVCHLELTMCISKLFHWLFILFFGRASGHGGSSMGWLLSRFQRRT